MRSRVLLALFSCVPSVVLACPSDGLVAEVSKTRPLANGNMPELSILIVNERVAPTTLVAQASDGRVTHIAYVASRHDPPCPKVK
jgi:hypothetical protein